MEIKKLHSIERLDARVPKWNMDTLTKRNCPFCGSENEAMLIRPDQLPVAFCSSCGCWYVARLPSASDVYRMYDGYFYAHRPADLSGKQAALMTAEAREMARSDWHLQVLSKALGGLRNKRLVEVGCGLCRFLIMARTEGAAVAGCDLSPEACVFARDHLGIPVHQQTLNECSSSIGKADAVVMRDLIEHPMEPMVDIETAYNILKPGGCLLLHTPNGGEAGSRVETAKEWVGFRVDLEHLQYLSPHTVNWLSRKLNMRIERLDASGFPGLKGIEKLPDKRRFRLVDSVKRAVKRIPLAYTMVKTLRAVKTELNDGHQDPRLGSYHLLAILRKV